MLGTRSEPVLRRAYRFFGASLAMEPAISIKGLTKSYGDVRALDNFSMEVREGEFFGFLGPNGARQG